mgnify:CR=1 FL=1
MHPDEPKTLDELSTAIFETVQILERSLITTRSHLDGCDVGEFGDLAVGPRGIMDRFAKISDFLDALVDVANYIQSKVF